MAGERRQSTRLQHESRDCNAAVTRDRQLYGTVTAAVTDVYGCENYDQRTEHGTAGWRSTNTMGVTAIFGPGTTGLNAALGRRARRAGFRNGLGRRRVKTLPTRWTSAYGPPFGGATGARATTRTHVRLSRTNCGPLTALATAAAGRGLRPPRSEQVKGCYQRFIAARCGSRTGRKPALRGDNSRGRCSSTANMSVGGRDCTRRWSTAANAASRVFP
jgi:hypothetical protein